MFLLSYDHKQVRVTHCFADTGAMCCSAILLSLPRATARLTDSFEIVDEKSIEARRKRREIKAVSVRAARA